MRRRVHRRKEESVPRYANGEATPPARRHRRPQLDAEALGFLLVATRVTGVLRLVPLLQPVVVAV